MKFPALEENGLFDWLSAVGRRYTTPRGILYWSGRAREEARWNATVGSAAAESSVLYESGDDDLVLAHLPELRAEYPDLSPGQAFAYAPILGTREFRAAWQGWLLYKARQAGVELANHATLPIVTSGITHAITLACRLFLEPGDAVILPEKYWGNYGAALKMEQELRIDTFPFYDGAEFNLDGFVGACESHIRDTGRATAILNFPNNPTGYAPPASYAEEVPRRLSDLVERTGGRLLLLFDDAYEGYTYETDRLPWSLFYRCVDLHPSIWPVKLDGVSKELLCYGARLGGITFGLSSRWDRAGGGPAVQRELEDKVGGMIRATVSSCNHSDQEILARFLSDPDRLVRSRRPLVEDLGRRARAFRRAAERILPPFVTVDPFHGGFFAFINLQGLSSQEVAETLLVEHGVGIVPQGEPGGAINGIRVAWSGLCERDMEPVCERIAEVLRKASVEAGRVP